MEAFTLNSMFFQKKTGEVQTPKKTHWCANPTKKRRLPSGLTVGPFRVFLVSISTGEDRFVTGKLDGSALMNLVAQKLHEAKISTAHLCHFFRCNKRVFFLGGDFFFRLKTRTVPWLENPWIFVSLIKLPHQNWVDFFSYGDFGRFTGV